MTRPGNQPPATHREVANRARREPGVWVRVNAYRTHPYAVNAAGQIRAAGKHMTAYAPAGSFETRIEDTELETEVYVRYAPIHTTTPGRDTR